MKRQQNQSENNLRDHSYFNTDAGKLSQYRRRKRRRLQMPLDSIEPQSKNMPEEEKDKFQQEILQQLNERRRAAFRGPLALSIQLSTTRTTAPQAHTIAKNLLDLLGSRRIQVKSSRKHLLYKDDSQVHSLSVSCNHGQEVPMILISACSLRAMIDDLELACEASRKLFEDDPADWFFKDQEGDWVTTFRSHIENEADHRYRLGDQLYEALLNMERWHAQRALLRQSGIDSAKLSWLFGRPNDVYMRPLTDMWNDIIRNTPLRMHVGELPTTPGSSAAFKERIDAELEAFKCKWGWLITPLVVPVSLEVIVRPSPATPKAVLHDLDNIVRDYLLPRIVPKFGTVTDYRWTIDFDKLKRVDPNLAAYWGSAPLPPKATRNGVTRYEAWRLPPAPEEETGFVSVALVADTDATGDFLQRVDDQINRWSDMIIGDSLSGRRRRS